MRPQIGQLVNNKYRLLRLIGDGGMGSVFEARHEVLGTTVALKFLHSELTRRAGLVQRFLQEARIVSRIQSPHVVRVSDVDQTAEGNAFIVMEFIEGKSLQAVYEDLYRAGRRLSFADAMDYALQMLDGLEAAHSAGIVHRDLKPDNVMITRGVKGAPLLKILDFGIAKLKVEGEHMKGLTRPGVVMGTPEYMAPEQAFSADQVDARADIFAFGVMLFEMLAGRRPVGGDEPHQIAAQYLGGEVAKLTDLAPTVPAGLAAVVHKAMSAQAKDRWSSVVELRREIEPYAEAIRGGTSASTKPSDRPREAASAVKSDGEANPSGAAQVMAAMGAAAAAVSPAPEELDGGATEKSEGLPAMMLGGHTPTSASSPAGTPIPSSPDDHAPWATEPAEYDPLQGVPGQSHPAGQYVGNRFTATEGFVPSGTMAGGTDLGAPLVGGTAIDPGAPVVGTAPMTPAVGGYVAAPPHPARKKKSGGLGWMLFLATTLTGAVLGGVFLWDRLELGDGPEPKPIATGQPPVADLGPTQPARTIPPTPATTTPPVPPPAMTTPPPPATTAPPPRPPPTQPRPPATQQPTPPTIPTFPTWTAPTIPSSLPPLIPINPQPQPTPPQQDPPQPQPTTTRPTLPWRPRIPGRGDNAPAETEKPRETPKETKPKVVLKKREDASPAPSTSSSSRPRVAVPRK